MGEYIANKIRCKKCKHYKSLDKNMGLCKAMPIGKSYAIVRANYQFEICFESNET